MTQTLRCAGKSGGQLAHSTLEPTAFLVATTEVDGEGCAGKSRNDGVVELDPPAQPLIERLALTGRGDLGDAAAPGHDFLRLRSA